VRTAKSKAGDRGCCQTKTSVHRTGTVRTVKKKTLLVFSAVCLYTHDDVVVVVVMKKKISPHHNRFWGGNEYYVDAFYQICFLS
jgi:hypothetical protein